jgi:hypothetical protein
MSTNGWAQWCVPVILGMQGSTRRTEAQASQEIKQNPASKIISAKRDGGMAQVVELLSSK